MLLLVFLLLRLDICTLNCKLLNIKSGIRYDTSDIAKVNYGIEYYYKVCYYFYSNFTHSITTNKYLSSMCVLKEIVLQLVITCTEIHLLRHKCAASNALWNGGYVGNVFLEMIKAVVFTLAF